MRERILTDLVSAMKNKDKERLSVLRMVKGAMQLEEINVKHELDDGEVIRIISKQIKTRKDSIVEFEKGNRTDLINATNNEISILEEYMPEQMSEEEIAKVIDDVFNQINPSSPKDMGKIMSVISPLVKGKADMGLVNKMIKEKLNNI
ncbi:MAG: GatB/YqeY domain-containing protein [Firmicutes bacterium]|nr:GatB/YqeY domain-containing protein [Bacillota bacterium]